MRTHAGAEYTKLRCVLTVNYWCKFKNLVGRPLCRQAVLAPANLHTPGSRERASIRTADSMNTSASNLHQPSANVDTHHLTTMAMLLKDEYAWGVARETGRIDEWKMRHTNQV